MIRLAAFVFATLLLVLGLDPGSVGSLASGIDGKPAAETGAGNGKAVGGAVRGDDNDDDADDNDKARGKTKVSDDNDNDDDSDDAAASASAEAKAKVVGKRPALKRTARKKTGIALPDGRTAPHDDALRGTARALRSSSDAARARLGFKGLKGRFTRRTGAEQQLDRTSKAVRDLPSEPLDIPAVNGVPGDLVMRLVDVGRAEVRRIGATDAPRPLSSVLLADGHFDLARLDDADRALLSSGDGLAARLPVLADVRIRVRPVLVDRGGNFATVWQRNTGLTVNADAAALGDAGLRRAMANAEILDHICGQIDRNLGNMLVRPPAGASGAYTLRLIDNDFSFPTDETGYPRRPNESHTVFKGTLPSLPKAVDKGLAEKLAKLNVGDLRARLSPYLTEAELDALEGRIAMLKAHVDSPGVAKVEPAPKKGAPDWQSSPPEALFHLTAQDVDLDDKTKPQSYFGRVHYIVTHFARQ